MKRVGAVICNFNKKEYLELKSRMNEINRLVIDPEYSEYAAIVLDGTLKAVGQKNLIFVYENIHNAKIYNENVIKIDEMFEFIFKEKYISIATDIDNWNKIKQEFNNKQKKYEYIDEPKKLLEKLQQKLNMIKKLKKEETLIVVSNPHDPYLLNNPYYHSIPFESEYSDSYVCVTNPNNTNPVVKLFMDLIEDGEL